MITDADIKKLAKVFATKDDINRIENKIDDLKTRVDILEDNVTGDIAKLHDEILITSSYRSTLEDHEHRITQLESK